jgi:hypothetical protein
VEESAALRECEELRSGRCFTLVPKADEGSSADIRI